MGLSVSCIATQKPQIYIHSEGIKHEAKEVA
jgi:hypothetical protein